MPDFHGIGTEVDRLLSTSGLQQLSNNVSAYENYAVFEIPLILDQVMAAKAREFRAPSSTFTSVDPFAGVAWAGLT